jgi:single-stranded DNA-binding protein
MAYKEVNAITLTGQIAAEPEMRFTGEGEPFTTLTLLCRQPTGRDPHAHERFRLVARGEPLAEQCNDLLPDAHVLVTGRLQSSTTEDPAERAQTPYEVLVREVLVLNSLPLEQPTITRDAAPPSRPPIARPVPPTRAGTTPAAPSSPPSVPRPGIPRGPRRNPSNA